MLIDCFIQQLALIHPMNFRFIKNGNIKPRVAVVVSKQVMIRFMEFVCDLLQRRGIEPTIFSQYPLPDRSSECLSNHYNSNTGLFFSRGYSSWLLYRNKRGANSLTKVKLFSALIQEFYQKPNQKCSKVVLVL